MKKIRRSSAIIIMLLLLTISGTIFSLPKTPPPAKTGAPGEGTCADCHTGAGLNLGPGYVNIAFSGVNNQYKPGKYYTITVTVWDTTKVRYGFQNVPLDENNLMAGKYLITDTLHTKTQKDNGTGRKYINNYTLDYSDWHVWTYKWKSPTNVGDITFYGTGNATDGQDDKTDDNVYSTTLVIKPRSAGNKTNQFESGESSGISVYPNPVTESAFTISFFIEDEDQMVEADIFNLKGGYVAPLFRAVKEAGEHHELVRLPAAVTSGIYLIVLKSGEERFCKKVMIEG